MVTLYYYASINNCLVVGTGNKVEDFGVGFYTKYGDGGVDVSPIADLMKSEVKSIGKEMGIINDIIVAKPTDGLWSDTRTDEEQIGASYNELEWAMDELFKGKDESDFLGREKEVFKILKEYNLANKHKMISFACLVVYTFHNQSMFVVVHSTRCNHESNEEAE